MYVKQFAIWRSVHLFSHSFTCSFVYAFSEDWGHIYACSFLCIMPHTQLSYRTNEPLGVLLTHFAPWSIIPLQFNKSWPKMHLCLDKEYWMPSMAGRILIITSDQRRAFYPIFSISGVKNVILRAIINDPGMPFIKDAVEVMNNIPVKTFQQCIDSLLADHQWALSHSVCACLNSVIPDALNISKE